MKFGLASLGNLIILTSLMFGTVACNKSGEYYEKVELESALDGPVGVDGSTDAGASDGSAEAGSEGGVQGGVDGGATGVVSTGGSEGGSTGGTSTGGTSTGGSSGGSSTTGGSGSGGSTGGNYTAVTETFMQSTAMAKKLDIIWVIDNSGSMADEQASLGTNFSAFIDDFITDDVDFKMGITTTDTSSEAKRGLVVPGSFEKLTAAAAQANETQFKADFRSLVNVGTSGSGTERGLDGAEGFIQRYGQSFLRADAYLAIVVLSDEEDQSSKTVQQYTDYYKSQKSSPGLVKIYSIVDTTSISPGMKGQRYMDASTATAGVSASIKGSFYQALSDMGDAIINLLDSFALAHNPIPGSLQVYVNNVATTAYTFDVASRSIKFNANSVPAPGSEIRVTYQK